MLNSMIVEKNLWKNKNLNAIKKLWFRLWKKVEENMFLKRLCNLIQQALGMLHLLNTIKVAKKFWANLTLLASRFHQGSLTVKALNSRGKKIKSRWIQVQKWIVQHTSSVHLSNLIGISILPLWWTERLFKNGLRRQCLAYSGELPYSFSIFQWCLPARLDSCAYLF